MLLILMGEDMFSMRQTLADIKRGLGDPALLEINTAQLEGQKLTPDELTAVCEAMPFLSEKRLVVVAGLLERFESRARAGRKRKNQPVSGPQAESQAFAGRINRIPGSTALVLMDNTIIKNSNPLLSEIAAGAEVRTFPSLKEARLKQWIRHWVAEGGGSIAPEAVDMLARLIGGDLWMMSQEIDKLMLYAVGRRIEGEDVGRVTSHSQETNVFAMVDAIIDFKSGIAEQLLHQLLQRGATPAYLMTMLARQMQLIARTKELRNQHRPEAEIQRRLGLASEFALRRTLEQAARYPAGRLRGVYRALVEADLSIKTGRRDGELALTILVAELCQR